MIRCWRQMGLMWFQFMEWQNRQTIWRNCVSSESVNGMVFACSSFPVWAQLGWTLHAPIFSSSWWILKTVYNDNWQMNLNVITGCPMVSAEWAAAHWVGVVISTAKDHTHLLAYWGKISWYILKQHLLQQRVHSRHLFKYQEKAQRL